MHAFRLAFLLLCLGILKMAVSFKKIYRHSAMKWDLFEQIVNKEGGSF